MSGGRFNYAQSSLCWELYPALNVDYGDDGHKQSRMARKFNPFEDREVSELVWDVLCLIHSLDWYKSGDTGEDTYKDDVEWFKKKWLNRDIKESVEEYKKDMKEFADSLIEELALTYAV